jgi:hypothetical protein
MLEGLMAKQVRVRPSIAARGVASAPCRAILICRLLRMRRPPRSDSACARTRNSTPAWCVLVFVRLMLPCSALLMSL